MKRFIYGIFAAGLSLTACTEFDEEVSVVLPEGPTVSVEASVVNDNAIHIKVTPAKTAIGFAYAVAQKNPNLSVSAADIASVNYATTDTCKVIEGTIGRLKQFTTYTVYAVAYGNDGKPGAIVAKDVTTTDGVAPQVVELLENKGAAIVQMSEDVFVTDTTLITATIYNRNDMANPVDGTVKVQKVEAGVIAFMSPEAPANSIVFISWAAGAFKDASGKPIAALNSGISAEGYPVGAYYFADEATVSMAKATVSAKGVYAADKSFIADYTKFQIVVACDFKVFKGSAGTATVTYSGAAATTVLTAPVTIVSDSAFAITLPEAPRPGDIVTAKVNAGAVADINRNDCEELEIKGKWQYSYCYTAASIEGTYGAGVIYADNEIETEEEFEVEVVETAEDGSMTVNIWGIGSTVGMLNPLQGVFDAVTGVFTAQAQPIGKFTYKGEAHDVYAISIVDDNIVPVVINFTAAGAFETATPMALYIPGLGTLETGLEFAAERY